MANTITATFEISATPEAIFRAMIETAELERWFAEHADVLLDDGRYDFWGVYTPGAPNRDQGHHTILEVAPSRLKSMCELGENWSKPDFTSTGDNPDETRDVG